MEKYNNNYYICLCDGKPCGFIGEIDGDIRVCTDPNHQGKGVGSFMISEITKLRPNIYAKVKIDNISSVKAFEKAGYEKKYFLLEPKVFFKKAIPLASDSFPSSSSNSLL